MKTAIYVRVSTQEQATEGYSIQEQIERLTKYCEAMSWPVYKVYTDAGFSGANTDRPALNQMLRDIEAGKVGKVLVYKLDRLSRSQLDTLYLIEKVFLANGVDFISMNENFDTSTPFGRAMIGILAVFAQLEREQIKERMIMGKEARAKEGKFCGTWNVPIGYDYFPDRGLVINEFERIQVLEVFEMFLDGVPIKRMIKILADKGYRHKHGEWNDRTIRNVLRAETYLGKLTHHGKYIQAQHEPIITQEMHDRAVRILDERKRAFEQNKRPGKVQSYLGGLLVCKQCGAKYSKITTSKDKSGKKRCYYSCCSRSKASPSLIRDPNCKNKNWRMSELDEIIFDQVRMLKVEESVLEQSTEEKQKNRSDTLRTEIAKINLQLTRLMDLYVLGNLPIEQLQAKADALTGRKEKLEAEIDMIENEEREAISKQDAAKIAQSFGDVLDAGDFLKIREVLTSLIDRIELDGENIEIHWNFS